MIPASNVASLIKNDKKFGLLEERLTGRSPTNVQSNVSSFQSSSLQISANLKFDQDTPVSTLIDAVPVPVVNYIEKHESIPVPIVEPDTIVVMDSDSQHSQSNHKRSPNSKNINATLLVGSKRSRSDEDSRSHLTSGSLDGSVDRRAKSNDDNDNISPNNGGIFIHEIADQFFAD
jgi:hypothetical protein